MDVLSSYLPQDRRQALSRGVSLPNRATGSVLLADITGITPLADTMAAPGVRASARGVCPLRATPFITRHASNGKNDGEFVY
jgi:hypothetical protein